MPVERPQHIETQDPKYFAFGREVYLAWALWAVASFLLILAEQIGLILSLVTLGILVLATLLRIYHKLQIEQVRHYWQTEALFSIYSTLRIEHPLPPMRLWAASPDFLVLAISLIRRHKPQVIFEVGSGVSTLLAGYCLRAQGSGQVISLEHEMRFTEVTRDNILAHGLQDYASVRHAPLQAQVIEGETRMWYDTSALADLPGIDLLVVDGPPEGTQAMARYPALPMLFAKLNEGAYILVDDFMRDDEYAMVNQWLSDYDLTVVQTYANEKGAVILRKGHQA